MAILVHSLGPEATMHGELFHVPCLNCVILLDYVVESRLLHANTPAS